VTGRGFALLAEIATSLLYGYVFLLSMWQLEALSILAGRMMGAEASSHAKGVVYFLLDL
jgi:hypothetical protein